MLTAYDYPTAKIVDEAGVPLILVGDSLGNVVLGYDSTVFVTMDVMIHHTAAVVRGAKRALVIGDMPFMSYQTGPTAALENAARFLREAGAQGVKLEGGEVVEETIAALVDRGIPVMGHIGYTPQSAYQIGQRVQGRTVDAAEKLVRDALAVERAGAFAIVLELVPAQLAKLITERLSVPTIGIGAGPDCDGPGAGGQRHARPLHGLRPQARQAVRAVGGDDAVRRDGLRGRGPRGHVPD